MKQEVFAEVCAPLLAMKKSAMLCISTLRGTHPPILRNSSYVKHAQVTIIITL